MNERIQQLKEKERESTMQVANQNKGAIENIQDLKKPTTKTKYVF